MNHEQPPPVPVPDASPAQAGPVAGSEEPAVPFPSWEAWNRIRNGYLMPYLESDRDLYESQKRFAAEHIVHTSCVECKERFSDLNCRTQAGWQETQISGLCERCFDYITAEPEEEEDSGVAYMDEDANLYKPGRDGF